MTILNPLTIYRGDVRYLKYKQVGEALGWSRDGEEYHLFDGKNTVGVSLTQFQCIPNVIVETRTMYVPENYQLPVHDVITVDGVLIVDGELVVF